MEHGFAKGDALPLRLGFRHASPCDFGIGVGDGRNLARIEKTHFSCGVLGRDVPFMHGLVRKHRLARDITDRKDVIDVRAHLLIDGDEASLRHRNVRRL